MALFSGVFAIMGWGSFLPRVGSTVMYPFQWLTSRAGDGIAGFFQYFEDVDKLRDELDSLKAENESLQGALVDAEIVQDENAWLYQYLSMKVENPDYALCAATVTAVTSVTGAGGDYLTSLTLNRGSTAGIAAGMPVVTGRGLVGVVSEVGPNYCRVTTMLNPSAAVGVITSRAGERGLSQGDYALVQNGQAMVRQMREGADVTVGDILLTSGQGSVYPYGIPIGRVEAVSANAYSRTTEATVTPFVDFSDLSQVLVMTEYDRTLPEDENGEGTP